MKWYNYGSKWFNITICSRIDLDEPNMEIHFFVNVSWNDRIVFLTRDEYKIEAEKIKELMGIKDYQSRCC